MRKHFRFINLVPLTICSANPQDMSHEIKFVRKFSLSSLMHKWRRMIIWQNWPIVLFGVCKFSPFRVKTKEFLILTLNRFMCISAKKNWLRKFICICIEGGEKAGQCSGKAYLAIREGGNLPPLEKTRDSSPTREPGNPGESGACLPWTCQKQSDWGLFCQGFLARMSKCTFKTRPTKTKSSRPDGQTNLWNPLF